MPGSLQDMHGQRGQGTIDYVALLAVLALLLGAAAATAAAGAPGVTNAVMSQVRRALCIVTGAACAADRGCRASSQAERDAKHVALTIVIIRLDGDRYVLREELSDGKVRLTIAHRGGVGRRGRVRAARADQGRRPHDRRRASRCNAGSRGGLGHGEVLHRRRRPRGGRDPACAAGLGAARARPRGPRAGRDLLRGRHRAALARAGVERAGRRGVARRAWGRR